MTNESKQKSVEKEKTLKKILKKFKRVWNKPLLPKKILTETERELLDKEI